MIHIYIESGIKKTPKKTTNEYNFIEKFIEHHFPGKTPGKDYTVEGWDGKDRWKEFQPILQQITDKGDKNIIIFDADYPTTLGGFTTRNTLYESYKKLYSIDFSLFLWPNHADDGDFETMLEQITQPDHHRILRCFETFEKTIEGYNTEPASPVYHTPNQKTKIYTYISTIIKTKEEERLFPDGFWAFDNKKYWDLDHPYLEPLRTYLTKSCHWV